MKDFCAKYSGLRKHTSADCVADKEGNESSEEFSDIRDDSDIFNWQVDPSKSWMTEQDVDEGKIEYIASLLRRNPLVPPDPEDESAERD